MALRLAVVVSQAPGLGGTPSAGHRSTAVANASAAASSATSRSPKRLAREATTRAHSSWWAWVIASRTSVRAHRNGRTSTFRLQAFDPSAASLSATSRSGASMTQKPGDVLLRLHEGPVGEQRLPAPVVDDGGRARRRRGLRRRPSGPGLEPVVEHVDGRHLVRGGQVGRVVDHGNQVLHLGSSPVVRAPLVGASHPCYERLCPDPTPAPGRLSRTSGRPVTRPLIQSGDFEADQRSAGMSLLSAPAR